MLARLRKSVLGAVFNTFSGIGTENDSGNNFQFANTPTIFSENEIIAAYTAGGIFQKVIDLIPNTACKFKLVNTKEELIPQHDDIIEKLDETGIINIFCQCSKSARLFRESYLILNVEDGLLSAAPLDIETGQLVDFFVADTSQITFELDNFQNRTMYYLQTEGKTKIPIHPSRVLLFKGKDTVPKIRESLGGYHCSLADGLMNSFGRLNHSLNTSSSLLSRMVTFVVKIAGLQDMVRAGEETMITNRLQLHRRGIGSIGGLVVDAESEDVSWLNLNLSGLSDLLRYHERYFTAETELTHDILWNEGSNNTASELESENWEETINDFLKIHWETNLKIFLRLFLPTVGLTYTSCKPMFEKKKKDDVSIIENTGNEDKEIQKVQES